jgi:chromosome segregation ATPase
MTGALLFVALAAILAAVVLFASQRTTRTSLADRERELAQLKQQQSTAGDEAAAARTEAKERREEAAQLREQLRDAKRRAFEQAESMKKAGGAPALREEIDKLASRLAEARAEAAAAADRAKALEAQADRAGKELERDLKAARGRLETDRRVYMVQKGELDVAHDRYAELRRRHDALRKEHEELIDAVRQAAREEKRQVDQASAPPPAPAQKPPEAPTE